MRIVGLLLSLTFGCMAPPEGIEEEVVIRPLTPAPMELTTEGITTQGPPVQTYADTEVWSVHNAWIDTDTADARAAGLAWGVDSGLSWDDKYSLWVGSMSAIDLHSGNGTTFAITTPTGKVLPAPYVECAEAAYFLRSLFASWYHLPFYVEAIDGDGERVFLGHFGFVTQNGARYGKTAKFANYPDHSDMSAADIAEDGWPEDSTLRSRKIYGDADAQPFLGEDAHFGTFADELLLNKRVGYFMMMLLPYFGSVHFADDSIAWHVMPEGLRSGDLLIKRWQKRGVGHLMLVKEVVWSDDSYAVAEVASGSIPRRQPRWSSPTSSKMMFTNRYAGGLGENTDGEPYVDLGGGLKSFLSAFESGGHWRNQVPPARLNEWIPDGAKDERSARPEQFQSLLVEPDPLELRDELLALVDEKRAHLQDYPSSCSAREAREMAFDSLYDLMLRQWGWDRQKVDESYRILDDYVFAELAYSQSKTCCWNSTNNEMYQVVMDYNLEQVESQPDTCVEPLVFMARDGDYAVFADYAGSTGRSEAWVDWSADESCPQASVANDTEAQHKWSDFCVVADELLPEHAPTEESIASEPNESAGEAVSLEEGVYNGLEITSGDEDWFRVEGGGDRVGVSIHFDATVGDLDLLVQNEAGEVLDSSRTTASTETVEATADTVWIRVIGYSGATGTYEMKITID